MSASRMLSGKLLEPTTTVPPLASSSCKGSELPEESSEEPQPASAAVATTSRETAYVADFLVLRAMVTFVIQTCRGRGRWWQCGRGCGVATIQAMPVTGRQGTNRSPKD